MLTRIEKYKVAELLAQDVVVNLEIKDVTGIFIGTKHNTSKAYNLQQFKLKENITYLSKLLKKELIRCL